MYNYQQNQQYSPQNYPYPQTQDQKNNMYPGQQYNQPQGGIQPPYSNQMYPSTNYGQYNQPQQGQFGMPQQSQNYGQQGQYPPNYPQQQNQPDQFNPPKDTTPQQDYGMPTIQVTSADDSKKKLNYIGNQPQQELTGQMYLDFVKFQQLAKQFGYEVPEMPSGPKLPQQQQQQQPPQQNQKVHLQDIFGGGQQQQQGQNFLNPNQNRFRLDANNLVQTVQGPGGNQLQQSEVNSLINEIEQQLNINDESDKIEQLDILNFDRFQQIYQNFQYNPNNEKFTDSEFPPVFQSLVKEKYSRNGQAWKNFEWKRPEQFFKGEYNVFEKSSQNYQLTAQQFKSVRNNVLNISSTGLSEITADDIQQGQLGDCYFLSSLSAIAEFPYRIKNIFVTKQKNDFGIYCVRMNHFGEMQCVIIDDHFPCYQGSRGPAFTRGNGNELWVLILEKAWAKLYKSYDRIEAGLTREALNSLTGAPTEVIWCDEYDETELFDIINNADKANFIMTCGSQQGNDLRETQAKQLGLVSGHAYTLIDAYNYMGHRLLKLRNPWGSREWQGKWGDNDKIWNDKIRRDLNHNVENFQSQKNDGLFFMEIDDFKKYFTDIQICHYRDNYRNSSVKLFSSFKNSKYIEMQFQETGEYYISIVQQSKRDFPDNVHYEYSPIRIFIGKQNQYGYQFVAAKQYPDREFWVKQTFEKGYNYIIQVKCKWFDEKAKEFVLTTYGPGATKFREVQKNAIPGFIERCLITHPRTKENQYQKVPYVTKCVEMLLKEGHGFLYWRNNGNKDFTTKVTLNKLQGVKLCKPYRGNQFEITVNPGQEKIICCTLSHKGMLYSLQEQFYC